MRKQILILRIVFFNVLCYSLCNSQTNTVGVLSSTFPTEGYNLLYPHNQSTVYLLNNCGEIVKEWENESTTRPGNIAYLIENGNIVIAKKDLADSTKTFGAGGAGGIIEWKTWDNRSIAKFKFMDEEVRAHHDIEPLPNGNLLAIVWEKKSKNQIVEAGVDTNLHVLGELWPDAILELDSDTEEIVWEWHAWDHLIQELDSTKENYGEVSAHPELIHLNYDISEGQLLRPDWMHTNSISYNEELDQILISVPHFNEIWILDHSTTTQEASGHFGGNSGKGGDLLFRYGNSKAYKKENFSGQNCFFQHDAKWVEVDQSSKYHGMISYFNNRVDDTLSQVGIIKPILDFNNKYVLEYGEFKVDSVFYKISHPSGNIFSSGLSSAQVLWNDNLLVLSGREGYAFELNEDNRVVWEYEVPLHNGEPVEQGQVEINNVAFRIIKYPIDNPAFNDKDLSAKGTLEISSNPTICTTPNRNHDQNISPIIFPNPTLNGYINIDTGNHIHGPIYLYNSLGEFCKKLAPSSNSKYDVNDMKSGYYILVTPKGVIGKIVINHY